MVKQAEKIRKRSPMTPVYGLIIAIVLFVLAMILTAPAYGILKSAAPGFRLQGKDFSLPGETTVTGANGTTTTVPTQFSFPSGDKLWFAVGLWLILLAFVFALVAILSGKSLDDAKGIQLPPRDSDRKKRR